MNIKKQVLILTVALSCSSFISLADETHDRIDKIKAEAHGSHPGNVYEGTKAANQALEQETVRATTGRLTPKEAAAFAFLGYYAKNVYAIPKICLSTGVTVETYPSHFAKLHSSLLATAAVYTNTTNHINKIMPDAMLRAKQELERVAAMQGTGLRATCEMIKTNGADLAEGARFSKVSPLLYSNLTRTQ